MLMSEAFRKLPRLIMTNVKTLRMYFLMLPHNPFDFEVKLSSLSTISVSLNDNAFIQLSSIIEEQFPEDDDFRDSKSKPSPTNSIPLPLTSQTLPMPFEGIFSINLI
ncbi:hypothetical protein MtrunA17_Chr7g0229731 [Medicago truncatula]|uniref:Uncharacterized protein n=1 Tax=Medicago truncatula TaxID=3880 RepID=A0A396H2J5_MEDTR|nr:hypothetical protein MtrunA17_Chr7g0229731 [Medicago truncatula]